MSVPKTSFHSDKLNMGGKAMTFVNYCNLVLNFNEKLVPSIWIVQRCFSGLICWFSCRGSGFVGSGFSLLCVL
jgi:hypothetical protein